MEQRDAILRVLDRLAELDAAVDSIARPWSSRRACKKWDEAWGDRAEVHADVTPLLVAVVRSVVDASSFRDPIHGDIIERTPAIDAAMIDLADEAENQQ